MEFILFLLAVDSWDVIVSGDVSDFCFESSFSSSPGSPLSESYQMGRIFSKQVCFSLSDVGDKQSGMDPIVLLAIPPQKTIWAMEAIQNWVDLRCNPEKNS